MGGKIWNWSLKVSRNLVGARENRESEETAHAKAAVCQGSGGRSGRGGLGKFHGHPKIL